MPQRVSDLLRMPDAGYSDEACLAFDEYTLERVLRFERMRDARKEVDAPRRPAKARPKTLVPLHSEAELLAELDVDPEDTETAEMVASTIAVDWDAIDWPDEATEAEMSDGVDQTETAG